MCYGYGSDLQYFVYLPMLRMVGVGEDVFGSGGVLPGKVPETKMGER